MSPSIALLVYKQVLPPSARTSLCMYRSKQTSEHASLAGIPNDRCSRARLRMRCVVALYRPMPGPSVGWASYKRDKQVNSDRPTIDRAARACTSSLPLLLCPHACANQLLRLPRVPQPRRKPSWEKTTWLASPTTDVTAVLVYEWNV